MIANVLSLNETTTNYLVTFDSGDEYSFTVHIEDKIVKFTANDDGIYLSKPDKNFFGKMADWEKRDMIEGLNNLKTMGKKKAFS